MDELESIEQLRGIICDVNVAELSANIQQPVGTGREARVSPAWVDSWRKAAARALDEIEREVADRYIELPLDADGVPIRNGDVLISKHHAKPFTVENMELFNTRTWTIWDRVNGETEWAEDCRHVKPRTVEDVLADFAAEIAQGSNGLEATRRYADEIRELMEVDE